MGDCEPLDLKVEEPLSNGYNISSSLGADAVRGTHSGLMASYYRAWVVRRRFIYLFSYPWYLGIYFKI